MLYCLKTYIGQILYGADYEHCGGTNGIGVDKNCKCSQRCNSIHEVAKRKYELVEKWGLTKDEVKKIDKEL